MNMLILLTLLWMVYLNRAYNFACPSQAHWNLRAKSMCKPQRNYTCLFNVTFRVNVYRETCKRPRILGPGYKYVFQPNLNRAACIGSRYQPFIFDTIGNSDCIYQKSQCNSLGQDIYESGNTSVDRNCICNTDKGYWFVRNPKNKCYCNPLTEDCSCHLVKKTYNKTIDLTDINCYDDRKMTRIPYLKDMFNNSRTIKIIEFDSFKYNLHYPTNRNTAAISIVILLLANFAVCIIVHRIIPRWIQIHNSPRRFAIVECSDCSITIEWYIHDQDDSLKYDLYYRNKDTDKWTVETLSTIDVLAEENGRRVYTLLNILPETGYELKLCSVDNHVKSHYTESKTILTPKRVLPEAINQLTEEDRTRYGKLMQSEKSEKRYFVRTMIVGKESVGKTCLLKRLLKEDISNVTSTDGVDIVVRRCKLNIDDGTWTIGKEIEDDKVDRIKRALIPTAENIDYQHMQEDEIKNINIQKSDEMFTNEIVKTTEVKVSMDKGDDKNESALVIQEDVDNDTQVNFNKNKDKNKTASLVIHEDLASDTKVGLEKNEDANETASLVMPVNLLSSVFSKSNVNTLSNLYALCELWDFAGQKEFYATHQAFLTSCAVYLVVANMEDDIRLSQCFADFHHIGEYVDFWFDSIHCHRTVDKRSDNGHFDPPILLVFTGKDNYNQALFKKREQELNDQIDTVLGLKSKYHHLHKKFYLSNLKDTDEEFEKLRYEIYKTAKNMDNWGKPFPLQWILLEHLIEINKNDGKHFINFTEMSKLATHSDINILNKDDLLLFLRFQHNEGNIIFFENIPDLIIINPKWLADAFRCLVSDRIDNSSLHHRDDWSLFIRQGKISESLITELFKAKDENQFLGQKDNLLEVMEKLDILVKIDNSNFIMPSMMPSANFKDVCEQNGILTDKCKRSSWLCFKFDFLPPSFFNHISAWFIKKYPSRVDTGIALYRGICMFDIEGSGCKKICVTMSTETIALQVLSFSELEGFGSTCSDIYSKVKQLIKEIIVRYKVKILFKLHFKCSDGYYYKDTFEFDSLTRNKECFCVEHRMAHQSEQIYSLWRKKEDFCGKSCMHGHPCSGLNGEKACLPCLSCNNTNQKYTANDMCMICYTEPLPSSPCIKLGCDHIFHYECIRQILEKRWLGSRITFGFLLCPICKTRISHPSLEEVIHPINCLFEDVKIKSLTRLQHDGLFKCDAINKPGGLFYQDPAGYAMERYAYYECSKCGKAYFGGEGRCEHEHNDEFNPADMVCGGCVDISREQECPKHGKDFIEFKCRYCCSLAVFYCFGTTHFCNTCHNNHTVVTNMSKSQLPQCPAAPLGKKLTGTECPLGLQHPPTGDEFSLGCALCKNLQCF